MTARDNRLFVEAVLYRYRAGISWRDLPERFGDFRVVHTRYRQTLPRDGLIGAMSVVANPYDNAQAESCMKTLKMEEVVLAGVEAVKIGTLGQIQVSTNTH